MSLTTHLMEQRTDEWYAARCGLLTASSIGSLLTPTLKVANNETSRGVTASVLAERITGFVDPTWQNADMSRGVLEEPRAVETYARHFNREVTTAGLLVRDDWGFSIGYSPDGLVGDDGLVEVKSPRQKGHLQTILDDQVPTYHMAQPQTGLLVSGRQWIDFVSFCGGMPIWVKRVEPDEEWQAAILAAAANFEDNAAKSLAAYQATTAGMPVPERFYEMEMVI